MARAAYLNFADTEGLAFDIADAVSLAVATNKDERVRKIIGLNIGIQIIYIRGKKVFILCS